MLGPVLRRGRMVVASLFLAVATCAPPAHADEQTELDRGRNAYVARQFDEADSRFRAMLDPKSGTLHDAVYINQAYMYWGAVMVAKKRQDEAQRIFEQLILRDSTFEPDPLAFPTAVLDVFTDTRGRLRERLTQQAQDAAKREAEKKTREDYLRRRERERVQELERMASEDKTLEHHSRWIASIPFGVGQFQNGKPVFGGILLGLEASFLIAGTAMVPFYFSELKASQEAYSSNSNSRAVADAEEHRSNAVKYQQINLVLLGLFAGTALVGIAEANYNYVPEATVVRRRPLPPPVSFSPRVSGDGLSIGWTGSF